MVKNGEISAGTYARWKDETMDKIPERVLAPETKRKTRRKRAKFHNARVIK